MDRQHAAGMNRSDPPTVAVIGAGWAGLAAAVELSAGGAEVTLFDAAPQAGGRARSQRIDFGEFSATLDNGQHLMMGAHRDTLALIDRVGAGSRLSRSPMRLRSTDGLDVRAARLPAPWHLAVALLRASGLRWSERIAMTGMLMRLHRAGWQVPAGETVQQLLPRLRQPAGLISRFWEPLCLGALNTPTEQACAASFAAILRDTLGASAPASDFIVCHAPLGELLPEPALDWLRARGGQVRLRTAVRGLRTGQRTGQREEARWIVRTDGEDSGFEHVVLALPPANAARLLASEQRDGLPLRLLSELGRFRHEPIATVWLAWPRSEAPQLPEWMMLVEQPREGGYGQWLFDRGIHRGVHQGWRIAGVVISARGRELLTPMSPADDPSARLSQADAPGHGLSPEAIGLQVARQLGCAAPSVCKVVVEKRATFLCTPDRPRPRVDQLAQALPGLWLAGDYLLPEYPATLESAVRSGLQAARLCLAAPHIRRD